VGSRDELNSQQFRIIRLNDIRTSGKASLLEYLEGPSSAESERNRVRTTRLGMHWSELLDSIPDEKKGQVSSLLHDFEMKEKSRRKRLQTSMDQWRLERAKLPKKKRKGFFFRKIDSWMSRKHSSPKHILAEQLKNELKLFRSLDKHGMDLTAVAKVLQGVACVPGTDTKTESPEKKQHMVVLDFKGDMAASRVKYFKDEISSLLSLPKRISIAEVILRLNSSGGKVTGYGLASAELERLSKHGIKVTVCIDEVAASGGYLIACVADKIYASPFAAIGSIGVISTTPNVARRLSDEGLEVIQTTAGKYKRTVTPWKEPDVEDLEKTKEDLEMIHRHFIKKVGQHRSDRIRDLEEVATGEVWFGEDAMSRGLVDDLITSEEYIQSKIEEGFELLHVTRRSNSKNPLSLFQDSVQDEKLWSLPMFSHSKEMPQLEMESSEEERIIQSFLKSLPSHQRMGLVKSIVEAEDHLQ